MTNYITNNIFFCIVLQRLLQGSWRLSVRLNTRTQQNTKKNRLAAQASSNILRARNKIYISILRNYY